MLSEDETAATLSLTTVEFVAEGGATKLILVEAGAFLDGREQPASRDQGNQSREPASAGDERLTACMRGAVSVARMPGKVHSSTT